MEYRPVTHPDISTATVSVHLVIPSQCLWKLYCVSHTHTVNNKGHRSHLHVHDSHLPHKGKTGEQVKLPRFTNTYPIDSLSSTGRARPLTTASSSMREPGHKERQASRGFPRCVQRHTTLRGKAGQTRSQMRHYCPALFPRHPWFSNVCFFSPE